MNTGFILGEILEHVYFIVPRNVFIKEELFTLVFSENYRIEYLKCSFH